MPEKSVGMTVKSMCQVWLGWREIMVRTGVGSSCEDESGSASSPLSGSSGTGSQSADSVESPLPLEFCSGGVSSGCGAGVLVQGMHQAKMTGSRNAHCVG